MKKQGGMAIALLLLALFTAVMFLSYFWWTEQQKRIKLDERLVQLEKSQREKRNEIREKDSSLNEKTSENTSLKRDISKLERNLKAQEANLAEKESIAQELDALKRSNNDALAKIESEKLAIQNKLNEALKASQAFEVDNQSLKEEKLLLEEQVANLTQSIDELTNTSTALNQQYLQARNQLESEKNRSLSVSQQLENLEQQLTSEQTALEELQTSFSQLNSEKESLNQENASLSETNKQLSQEKEQLVKQYKDGLTVIRIPNRVLFDSGSATINQRGEETLSLLAKALESFPRHLISVEGHTDKRKIGRQLAERYPSNWELSSARAASAIRLFIQKGIPSGQFQAVGYGETRPQVLGDTESELSQNRRIEIVLLPPVERQQKLLSLNEGEG